MLDSTHPKKFLPVRSRLSFRPLLRSWEDAIRNGRPGAGDLYAELLKKVTQYPELLEPIEDDAILEKHARLIEQMMTTIFPVTLSDNKDFFAVTVPFTFQAIYSSRIFSDTFLNGSYGQIKVPAPDTKADPEIMERRLSGIYHLILNKFYDTDLQCAMNAIYPFKDPDTGLDRYMELDLDTRYIDITTKGTVPELPCGPCFHRSKDVAKQMVLLQKLLPLENFEFEGMVILRIKEVTSQQSIHKIRNSLLTLHSFADKESFGELQLQMQNLLGIPGLQIGLSPFFTVNDHFVFSRLYGGNSILLPAFEMASGKKQLPSDLLTTLQEDEMLVIPEMTPESVSRYPFLKILEKQGWKSLIICPLMNEEKELLGTLEVACRQPGILTEDLVHRIEPAVSLFVLAVKKTAEDLDNQLNRIIREKFTAVQSTVEWRFTEAALNYLMHQEAGEEPRMESIVFEDVYPLYGAMDVRNSSVERNQAIQQDLLEQLQKVSEIIVLAKTAADFPLLDEVQFRIGKYRNTVSNILFSDDEVVIHNFLKQEVFELLSHLKNTMPVLKKEVEAYFGSLDPKSGLLHAHRLNFENSITYINSAVARFLDKEQLDAQEIYPHYFERFVTDGVDFNIYAGQSISPRRPFDIFFLRNLKIWQLSVLARGAQLTHRLEKELSLPLYTTQLILAHGEQISISFRSAERKFDVDGAYNIRYEIMKKRIDKVRIRDTDERLTQPGKIAVVYSQPKEASEYLEYIEYLHDKGLLTGVVEHFELEELQGIVGLRALRVAVDFGSPDEAAPVTGTKTGIEKEAGSEKERGSGKEKEAGKETKNIWIQQE
ncbi:MAG: hypothetical protein P4L51_21810 [Puia sp.]|nr:hypothetical protein [Puia sp.]